MNLYTIGFTKKKAEQFFNTLKKAGVKRIVDVRLNNVSQLAGFAKRNDLKYFLKTICDIDYIHLPELAPTKEILDDFKKRGGDWSSYKTSFTKLIENRQIANRYAGKIYDGDCLLCSEDTTENCHRRLIAEHFRDHWSNVTVEHL